MTRSNLQRFYRSFNTSSVQLLRLRGVPFVTVNSMALENDGCSLCLDAEKKIKLVSRQSFLFFVLVHLRVGPSWNLFSFVFRREFAARRNALLAAGQ